MKLRNSQIDLLAASTMDNVRRERRAAHWGKSAGILSTTSADPYSLFARLRGVFITEDESGQEYFFRLYDPRVLTTYLPTCQARELALFSGPSASSLQKTHFASRPSALHSARLA